MKFLIISLKSRNELYGFARILKGNGISVSIINTPASIASSCVLSIKTDFNNFSLISQKISQLKPKSFLGLYSVQSTITGQLVTKLI